MLQLNVIGHLGADAEVKEANGKKFVSFNVAHTEKWTGADNVRHESTTWVSCALNGDGQNILPYLKRGTCVFVQGRAQLRVYSSAKARAMVAGVNLSVDRIELVGGQADPVPREVILSDGVILRTAKAFFVDQSVTPCGLPQKGECLLLKDARGGSYQLDENGFVWPLQTPAGDGDTSE